MMFEVGDTVRLKTGKSPQQVMKIEMNRHGVKGLRCMYLSQRNYQTDCIDWQSWRPADNYELYEPKPETEKEPPMTELYQTKTEHPRFGTFLAKTSKGKIVLEMKEKGGTVAEAFDADAIEVVTPYTVNLQPLDKALSSVHVLSAIGEVELQDVLLELDTGIVFRVTALDTKSRSPKPNKSKWLKIPASPITFGDK